MDDDDIESKIEKKEEFYYWKLIFENLRQLTQIFQEDKLKELLLENELLQNIEREKKLNDELDENDRIKKIEEDRINKIKDENNAILKFYQDKKSNDNKNSIITNFDDNIQDYLITKVEEPLNNFDDIIIKQLQKSNEYLRIILSKMNSNKTSKREEEFNELVKSYQSIILLINSPTKENEILSKEEREQSDYNKCNISSPTSSNVISPYFDDKTKIIIHKLSYKKSLYTPTQINIENQEDRNNKRKIQKKIKDKKSIMVEAERYMQEVETEELKKKKNKDNNNINSTLSIRENEEEFMKKSAKSVIRKIRLQISAGDLVFANKKLSETENKLLERYYTIYLF
jgi:hypothetical protein